MTSRPPDQRNTCLMRVIEDDFNFMFCLPHKCYLGSAQACNKSLFALLFSSVFLLAALSWVYWYDWVDKLWFASHTRMRVPRLWCKLYGKTECANFAQENWTSHLPFVWLQNGSALVRRASALKLAEKNSFTWLTGFFLLHGLQRTISIRINSQLGT